MNEQQPSNPTLEEFLAAHRLAPDSSAANDIQATLDWLGHSVKSRVLLGSDRPGRRKLLLAVAHELLTKAPAGLGTRAATLSPFEAVALADAMADRYSPHTTGTEGAAVVREVVTGRFDNEAAAAFGALRQVGGHRRAAVPEWMETAIGDQDHWTPCEHVIEFVRLAVANTAPGIKWRHCQGLDYVTYKIG